MNAKVTLGITHLDIDVLKMYDNDYIINNLKDFYSFYLF